ncbi:Membrane associated serine protease, rhomboid family [Chitinophaga sp. CF118]|uniref:rhomboid family intramembrane serine protease n=1 Tax=Chitinophaga sp. CF118 TaxID=1884367 RepID=UPI0008EC13AD|nr:rhomboid family intramembrane serine protease [Chitinophaga sp. CF118]SFE70706.1 Membrane associated serine protease, rhomboid family [Chitinophaga sp. CF118]
MHQEEKGRLIQLSLGERRNMVTQLLLVNITVFMLLFFTEIIYNIEGNTTERFNQEVLSRVTLPASIPKLLHSPWTIITSLFAHNSFWMIVSNMIWLWCFGTLLQGLAGHRRILPLYLYSGLCGIVFYLLGMQFIPALHAQQSYSAMTGASASIMALAIGATTIAPNYRIYPLLSGGIPLWVITIIFIIINVGTHAYSQNDITVLPALLGGGLTGFFYMKQWNKGNDWGAGLNRLIYKITHFSHPKGPSNLNIVR